MVWHKGHGFLSSSSTAPWHASLCGVFFFGWSVMPFGPPLAPPCFPLLVARKVSYCPSMYDDGLVAVNACEHSVISSNMASSVQNTKSLEYVILYGEHRIFYDLKKNFPVSLSIPTYRCKYFPPPSHDKLCRIWHWRDIPIEFVWYYLHWF